MPDKMVSIAQVFVCFSLLVVFGLFPPNTKSQTATVVDSTNRDRGIDLYRKKNFVEAAKILKDVVKESEADGEAWYYLGLALTQQPKELKNATKAFETAIKLKPNYAAAHTGLSYVLLRRNKFSEAERAAKTALQIEPGIANAHYVIGIIHLNEEAFDEALKANDEALRLNPKLAAAYLAKSEALWGLWTGPLRKERCGLPSFARSGSAAPPITPPSPEQLEERRRKRKQYEAILIQSKESLETYLKLNPSDPSAHLWEEQLATLKTLTNIDKEGDDVVRHGDEVTTKARILAKREPQYTDEARRSGVRGTVVLRAILSKDGQVRNILVIRGLPSGLTWQAVEAARQVRFTPAMLDGKPVSMFVQMEYCFELY